MRELESNSRRTRKTREKRARSIGPYRFLVAAALCGAFMLSCWTRPASLPTYAARSRVAFGREALDTSELVVVLTWDGVRWQEVMNGIDAQLERQMSRTPHLDRSPESLLPNLHRLATSEGVLLGDDAAPITASSPSTVSLPGYSEIFSGRSPTCSNNDCPATEKPTLLDEWQAAHPETPMTIISSWSRTPRAAARDLSPIAVSAGRAFVVRPDEFCNSAELCKQFNSGAQLAPWPGTDDYRPDRATASLALTYLQTHHPQFLFVGLGDTDEYAHRGDYDGYLGALRRADDTLGALHQWLSEQQRQGHRTLLVVTADHGRSSAFMHHGGAPEAARVWALFAGSVVTARGRLITTPRRLADIAPTIRSTLGLASDTNPAAGTSLFPLLSPSEQNGSRLFSYPEPAKSEVSHQHSGIISQPENQKS